MLGKYGKMLPSVEKDLGSGSQRLDSLPAFLPLASSQSQFLHIAHLSAQTSVSQTWFLLEGKTPVCSYSILQKGFNLNLKAL